MRLKVWAAVQALSYIVSKAKATHSNTHTDKFR